MKIKFEGTMEEWQSMFRIDISTNLPEAGLSEEPSTEDVAFLARARELALEAMDAEMFAGTDAEQPVTEPPAAEAPKRRRRTAAQIELERLDAAAAAAAKAAPIEPPPEEPPVVEELADEEFPMDEVDEATARAKVASAMQSDRSRTVAVLKGFAKSFGEIPADKYPALMEALAWA